MAIDGENKTLAALAKAAFQHVDVAQEPLREMVLAATSDIYCLFDSTGTFLYVNLATAKAWNIPQERFPGKTWHDLGLPAKMMERFDAQREDVIRTGQPLLAGFSYHGQDGLHEYEYRISPVFDAAGRVDKVVYIAREITAQKRAEAEVAALNARLHRAVYEANHRIKNQLQVLASMVDIIIDERDLIPSHEFKRVSLQLRALGAIHDILTVDTRIDGTVRRMSGKALLDRVLAMLQEAAGSHCIDFQVEDAPLPVPVSTSLALILNELVSNALKHGRNRVEVRFRIENEMGILEVRDDGPGFPEGFDPVKAANTGLDLIAGLTHTDLSGSVRYENREDRGGARVIVIFPLSASS